MNSPAVEGRLDREVRQREPSAHVAWCRYVTKHERPTRIVLCDSDAEGAFPVFRYPHDDECKNDMYARSVCEGMWADKCDDVIALVDALRAVYSLAGENRDVKRIVHEAIAKHGGPEVATAARARIDDVVNEVVTIALREKAKQRTREMMRDGTLLQQPGQADER